MYARGALPTHIIMEFYADYFSTHLQGRINQVRIRLFHVSNYPLTLCYIGAEAPQIAA